MKTFLREYWVVILFVVIAGGLSGTMLYYMIKYDRLGDMEKDYCGKVIHMGYDPPSSGYKTHSDAQYWMVIEDEDIHKAIRVHVTPACYYSLKVDQRVCFTLSGKDMANYGNTQEWGHMK